MSLLFALRGDSLIPRFTKGFKDGVPWVSPANFASLPASIVQADPSVFGGRALDFRYTNSDTHAHFYSALRNWARGRTGGVIVRVVPDWTGDPVQNQYIHFVGDQDASQARGGIAMIQEPGYPLNIRSSFAHDGGGLFFNIDVNPTWVAGVATDICVSWDDGTGLVSVSQEGVLLGTAALTAIGNPTYPERYQLDDRRAGTIRVGMYPSDLLINEILHFDHAVNPVYAPRTGFWPCANVEGAVSIDPGVGNVLLATAYQINGVDLVGTRDEPAVPDPADVRLGVAVGAGTGTLDLPGVSNVRFGTTFDGATKTGTAKIPTTGNTKDGVAVDVAGVGTYRGLDLNTDPGVGFVRKNRGYVFDGTSKTGTDESTDPGVANVALGEPYKIHSVDYVGTLSLGTTISDLRDATDELKKIAKMVSGMGACGLQGDVEAPELTAEMEAPELCGEIVTVVLNC